MNETGIEYLVTADKNIRFQQNYSKFNVKLIVLDVPDLQCESVLPFVAKNKTTFEQNKVLDSPRHDFIQQRLLHQHIKPYQRLLQLRIE